MKRINEQDTCRLRWTPHSPSAPWARTSEHHSHVPRQKLCHLRPAQRFCFQWWLLMINYDSQENSVSIAHLEHDGMEYRCALWSWPTGATWQLILENGSHEMKGVSVKTANIWCSGVLHQLHPSSTFTWRSCAPCQLSKRGPVWHFLLPLPQKSVGIDLSFCQQAMVRASLSLGFTISPHQISQNGEVDSAGNRHCPKNARVLEIISFISVPKIEIKTARSKHYAWLFDLSMASSILPLSWSVTSSGSGYHQGQ